MSGTVRFSLCDSLGDGSHSLNNLICFAQSFASDAICRNTENVFLAVRLSRVVSKSKTETAKETSRNSTAYRVSSSIFVDADTVGMRMGR